MTCWWSTHSEWCVGEYNRFINSKCSNRRHLHRRECTTDTRWRKKTANTVRAQTHSCTKFHTVVGATLKLDIYCMLFQGVFPLLCKLVAGVQHKCRGKEQKRWELCGWVFLPAANCLVWKLWKWCKRLVIYKYQSESLSSRTLGIISKVTDISHNSTKNEFSDKITALHCRND